ncbi:hypothetical protein EXS73_01910 [Candidatus Pacearchaeota archaeon]|nr:hypothetical protein [Candidatus Pacearchaeota archaeon]
MKFLRASETKKILEQLEKQFGITSVPGVLVQAGDEKLRLYSGNLPIEDLTTLSTISHIEGIGTYLLREEHEIRLSFDALHILKDQITKGIVELSPEEFHAWIRGRDVTPKEGQGTVAVKFNGDFFGCGKLSKGTLINHVPKERRLRK